MYIAIPMTHIASAIESKIITEWIDHAIIGRTLNLVYVLRIIFPILYQLSVVVTEVGNWPSAVSLIHQCTSRLSWKVYRCKDFLQAMVTTILILYILKI